MVIGMAFVISIFVCGWDLISFGKQSDVRFIKVSWSLQWSLMLSFFGDDDGALLGVWVEFLHPIRFWLYNGLDVCFRELIFWLEFKLTFELGVLDGASL